VTLVLIWIVVAVRVLAAALGVAAVHARSAAGATADPGADAGAAVVLTLYGGVLVVAGVLVVTGVTQAAPDADWTALHGHLYLWDPWFPLWGLLLLAAAVGAGGRGRLPR
jgi:hypothetical protein